jgi:hypothetical protein
MRKSKYGYYPKKECGTIYAEQSFRRMLPKMGRIVLIKGTYSVRRNYIVRLINAEGKHFVFRGFSWGYMGQGSRALVEALKLIGVEAPWLTDFNVCGGHHYYPNSIIIRVDNQNRHVTLVS